VRKEYNIPVKKVAITMGDPGGIGPEVIAKALSSAEVRNTCIPLVIGNSRIIKDAVRLARLPLKVVSVSSVPDSIPSTGTIAVYEIPSSLKLRKGVPCKDAGRDVVAYIRKAVELALMKRVGAVVTAPISKESLKMAGYSWRGHTGLLAECTKSKTFGMMFVGDSFKIMLATIHVPIKDVPAMVNEKTVTGAIRLAKKGMTMLGVRNPRIAVAGLNPHAGESGILGTEETDSILPAVRKAMSRGITVSGPHPPDVVFLRAWKGEFDIVVCMYHDQGLIPFKMLSFDTGVNVTVGLPIIRTSPDHGTAFDIAWKNQANPLSMVEAVKLATRLKLRV
jgi:4-hydroxythreonine-4-phosphate dehydrogenase